MLFLMLLVVGEQVHYVLGIVDEPRLTRWDDRLCLMASKRQTPMQVTAAMEEAR